MRINSVVRFTGGNNGRNIAFSRAPKKGNEEKQYNQALLRAFEYAGIEQRALNIHGASFPASNPYVDMKIGSPNGSDEFVKFLQLHGFNAIQAGPAGQLNRGDTSPYTSSVFAKNPLFINPDELTKSEWAGILSKEDVVANSTSSAQENKNYDRTEFNEASHRMENIMGLAWENFKTKLDEGDVGALALNYEFERFQEDNASWIDFYALADFLGNKNGTDFYPNWNMEDRDLIPYIKKGDRGALSRYAQIQQEHGDYLEKYKFIQFIADKQSKKTMEKLNATNFSLIGDIPVGCSSIDELVFGDVFLKGYKIGCEYGGPLNSQQLWGISLPDPDKLFNPDGSLGESGKYIRAKIKNALTGAQNIRIDHVMGLVNPYLYKPETVKYAQKRDESGKFVKYPVREAVKAGYLSELPIKSKEKYQQILPRIILPLMHDMGIDPNDVVWEDLGFDRTGVFQEVFRDTLNLPGISGLIWTKGIEAPKDNWAYIGCHDNKPGRMLIADGDIERDESWKPAWEPNYLAQALRSDPYKGHERIAIEKQIKRSPLEWWRAKLADLFHSTKKIQISFMDFFGINKCYNVPGTAGGDNWTLRLNSDYQDTYYKALENRESWAICMPEILKKAVQAKFDENVSQKHKPYNVEKQKADAIMRDLDHWSYVLREKSDN